MTDTYLRGEFNETIKSALNDVDEAAVKVHPHTGMKYFPSHELIRRANTIFGPGNWSTEILNIDRMPWEDGKGRKQLMVTATVRVTVYPVGASVGTSYDDVGTATGVFAENSLDMTIKGAVSDAEKRCLRHLGDAFGLFLYNKDVAEVTEESAPRQAPAAPRSSASAPRPAAPTTNRPTTRSDGMTADTDPDAGKYQCEEPGCEDFATGFQPGNGPYVPIARMREKSMALDNNAGATYCSRHYRQRLTKK